MAIVVLVALHNWCLPLFMCLYRAPLSMAGKVSVINVELEHDRRGPSEGRCGEVA